SFTTFLLLDPGGEVRRVRDGGQHAADAPVRALGLGGDGVVGAAVVGPAGGAIGEVRHEADHAVAHVLVAGQVAVQLAQRLEGEAVAGDLAAGVDGDAVLLGAVAPHHVVVLE